MSSSCSDVTTPLGLYTFGNEEKSVVVSGDIETIKDLKNMRIPTASASSAGSSAASQAAQSAFMVFFELLQLSFDIVGNLYRIRIVCFDDVDADAVFAICA